MGDSVFHGVAPAERIIVAYSMMIGGKRLSFLRRCGSRHVEYGDDVPAASGAADFCVTLRGSPGGST